MKHRYGAPPDNPAAYKPGVHAGKSPGTSPTPSANRTRVLQKNPTDIQPGKHTTDERDHQPKQPTLRGWNEIVAQLTIKAGDRSRMFERCTASLDSILQGLRPCLAMVNRTLERLDERLAPAVQPKPLVAAGPSTPPRVVSTPRTTNLQGTIIKYLVYKHPACPTPRRGPVASQKHRQRHQGRR